MSTPIEASGTKTPPGKPRVHTVDQHIVEFVSDSGEGAQTAGQLFGTVSARMGNGVWTVEIIPAEIEPPHRSKAGASGNRVRIASDPVTNTGEAADVVVAFNEQVLYGRIDVSTLYKPGTKSSSWRTSGPRISSRRDRPRGSTPRRWSRSSRELGLRRSYELPDGRGLPGRSSPRSPRLRQEHVRAWAC